MRRRLNRLLLALCVLMAMSRAAKGLEGAWQATLAAGAAKLRLVLTITKSAQGTHSGIPDKVDQGATIPIQTITVEGEKVRLEAR